MTEKLKYSLHHLRMDIPEILLDEQYISIVDKPETEDQQYLGQPDMIYIEAERKIIAVYPVGHGVGPILMKISYDDGVTWQEHKQLPKSWQHSYETPTLYQLDFTEGSRCQILISGMPNWQNNSQGGWQTSLSYDDGRNWTEFKLHHKTLPNRDINWSTVAMSSLIQLKDSHGQAKDQWLGVYHNENFVNYKTYLTFDEAGKEQWTEPEPLLNEYRAIEEATQLCEIDLFRSPDGREILALARSQSHLYPSTFFTSDDEGETWSPPVFTAGPLNGERHKTVYDPVTHNYLITFREIRLDVSRNGQIKADDWRAGNWVAWVGTYEDLKEQHQGLCRLILKEDFTPSIKGGDTGYAGIVLLPNQFINAISYGHWDEVFSSNWQGGVTTDLCYIIQAKFNLETFLENHLDNR